MGYNTSNRLTAIFWQPRRLTDRIWKTISPELLKLMEDARTGLILRTKKEHLLTFFKTFYAAYMQEHRGPRLPFNFGDLLEVPSVAEALGDMSAQTLPDTLLPELEQKLPVILEGRAQKLRSECIANVLKEREALGLLVFDSIAAQGGGAGSAGPSSSKARDVPTTDCPLLGASTAFTAFLRTNSVGEPLPQRDMTFGEVMDAYLAFPFPENVRPERQPLPWREPQFQPDFAKDAEEVLKQLGLPLNVTHTHMVGITPSIICKGCPGLWNLWSRRVLHQTVHRRDNTKANFQLMNLKIKPESDGAFP